MKFTKEMVKAIKSNLDHITEYVAEGKIGTARRLLRHTIINLEAFNESLKKERQLKLPGIGYKD